MAKPKTKPTEPSLIMDSEVVRQIRQHARAHIKTEVCGVLIGDSTNGTIHIEAAIAGLNAAQAGTHVTFTQDAWEHIYKIKDQTYPDARIVGWYHSHPGFGVFLSDHDTFIQKNFFSSPDQVAWVYDPHSDEEGCFGWVGGEIARLSRVSMNDLRGGEGADESRPEPVIDPDGEDVDIVQKYQKDRAEEVPPPRWMTWTMNILSHLTAIALGLLVAWYVFPRVAYVGVPIPVDPITGQPLRDRMIGGTPPAVELPPLDYKQKPNTPVAPDQKSEKDNNGQRQ